jgi:hypothetical protein
MEKYNKKIFTINIYFFYIFYSNNMAFIYLVSFFYTTNKSDINNYALITKNDIDILEILEIKQDNIIFNETINISEEMLNKIIKLYRGFNIVKITIIEGKYTIWIDNNQIVLLEKVLQKNMNKIFNHIYFFI